jgi:GWxTD domain-containing protein
MSLGTPVQIHSGCSSVPWRAALLCLALAFQVTSGFAQKKEKLASNYREWLDRDVVYIITKEERENFLKLASDEARDKFIEQFWEIRNPSPGSPTNAFKEEIYKRIAFANSRFSVGSVEEGWRTDRGHVYILLGPPQQKQVYRSAANLYPFEIWFYSTGQAGLPNFFYLLFYDRDMDGDYRFYSPYFDGPDKLTTGVEGVNSPSAGLRMIQASVGPEVARISLSLLPGEPVDTSSGQKSMESDLLLSEIKGYNNVPAYRNEIARRYKMRENVSTRMILSGHNLDVLTFPVRDSHGFTRLDYAVHLRNPSDMTLTKEPDGRYSYSVTVNVRVFGPDNKLIFSQEKHVSDSMDRQRMEEIQDRLFGYEGLLPLPPGKYRLVFELEDWSKKASYETERDVSVPQPVENTFVVPEILAFTGAEEIPDPVMRDLTPFAMGGVKFQPHPSATPTLNTDFPLQVAYQIWAPPKDPRSLAGQKLQVEYGIGQPALPGASILLRDEVAMEQFDAAGSLVSGKKLDLERRLPGNYVLTITVKRPDSDQKAYATAHFRLIGDADLRKTWDVQEPDILKDAEAGFLNQQRGLALLAQGQPEESRKWLLSALKLGHSNDKARAALVEAYFAKKDYAAVRSLYTDTGVTDKTDSQTLIRIATSLQRLGEPQRALSLLQDSIGFRPDDGPLYLALADVYRQQGDLQKALESEKKARAYLGVN